jgi:hypothetical protein
MKNFFLHRTMHVIKQKSSDNFAEKFTLQLILSFLCNLMDNFDWDIFLFFHMFFHVSFFSMDFSVAIHSFFRSIFFSKDFSITIQGRFCVSYFFSMDFSVASFGFFRSV